VKHGAAVAREPGRGDQGLIASASWMTGSHIVAQGFAYGSLILLAQWLPPSSFGTVALAIGIVYVAALVVDRGTHGAIVVQPRVTRSDLVRGFRNCMLVAVILATALAAGAGALVDGFADGGDAVAVAALALCLPLYGIAVVPTALLQKKMQFRRLAASNAAANVVSAVAAVILAANGAGIWALVARQLLVFALMAVLTTVLCWSTLREHYSLSGHPGEAGHSVPTERWFFLLGIALLLTANLDYFVIGSFGNAEMVGLYALAFTVAMAPSTHFAAQIGKVVFAAAALQPEDGGHRTDQSVRLVSALLLPVLPAGVLLAPVVIPAVLGTKWGSAVGVFQLLLVVGIGYAIVNSIEEALSGRGYVAFRAKAMVVRGAITLLALVILVPVLGIHGAALAQLAVFVAYAALMVIAGGHRAGTSPIELWRSLRPVATALCIQLAVTFGVLVVLSAGGADASVTAFLAAGLGLLASAPLLLRIVARMRS
jgi:O-antigen/teichoic acid export membrane protein